MAKAKIAFYWATSCGGCEISVLDIGAKILDVVEKADIVFFATSCCGWLSRPGYLTDSIFGCVSRNFAIAIALLECLLSRSVSESRPSRQSHALNGAIDGPMFL